MESTSAKNVTQAKHTDLGKNLVSVGGNFSGKAQRNSNQKVYDVQPKPPAKLLCELVSDTSPIILTGKEEANSTSNEFAVSRNQNLAMQDTVSEMLCNPKPSYNLLSQLNSIGLEECNCS